MQTMRVASYLQNNSMLIPQAGTSIPHTEGGGHRTAQHVVTQVDSMEARS